MDISLYISELLFDYDCVIVPGFGGFICNYKAADIFPVQNTISPPAKAVSFNRNLQNNDGLLVNYISTRQHVSFDAATDMVNSWVTSSRSILANKEYLRVKKVGVFSSDIEGNLQFAPFNEVNYLKSSYGLKTITVQPVVRRRGTQIEFTEKFAQETRPATTVKNTWRIAATVLLLVSLVGLAELMWMGVAIKPLQLNEASVFGFVGHIFKTPEPDIAPLVVEVETAAPSLSEETKEASGETVIESPSTEDTTIETPEATKEEVPAQVASSGPTYYIIVGAFAEEKNVEAAKQRLQQRFPDSTIFEDKGRRITKLGYSVGSNYRSALQQLSAAKAEDDSYWLLKQ